MADATLAVPAPALRQGRWLLYGVLLSFAAFFLVPLAVVLLNSVRTAHIQDLTKCGEI